MMTAQTRYYRIADHLIAISALPQQLDELTNYRPFLSDGIGENALLSLRVTDRPIPSAEGWQEVYTDCLEADMPRIEIYRTDAEWLFRIAPTRDSELACAMRCTADFAEADVYLAAGTFRFAVDNAAMLLFAFRTVSCYTLLFHASVTVRNGVGYLFLGRSGTGKSTHSCQWMKAFPDAWLLNDDNPVVRLLDDGTVRVYGSPWSGKTPCYKHADVPVGALVQLAQAPANSIRRLRMVQAYPYILSSVSGMKIRPEIMDALYASIARLLELTPVYQMDCLPNEEAARICYAVVAPNGE